MREVKKFFPDGRLKIKYNVDENDVKQGKSIEYYRSGTKFYEINFKDGKEDGDVFIYEKSGLIKQSGEYKNGKRHGVWIIKEEQSYYIEGKECKEEDLKLYLIKQRLNN